MSGRINYFKQVVVVIAMIGVVFPQTRLLAEQKGTPKRNVKFLDANTTLDVTLGMNGELKGRTVDHTGNPVVGAKVVIKRGKTEIAEAISDEAGTFTTTTLKSGTYQVGSGATVGNYRLWSQKAAPPSARPQALLVLGENGTRGQYGNFDPFDPTSEIYLVWIGATAAGLGIAALILAFDAERKANHAFHSP